MLFNLLARTKKTTPSMKGDSYTPEGPITEEWERIQNMDYHQVVCIGKRGDVLTSFRMLGPKNIV